MQPDLDRHRVRKQARGSQSARHQVCVTDQDRSELLSGNKIGFEGVLDRDRLRLTIGLNRPVVTGIRQIQQGLRMGLADH